MFFKSNLVGKIKKQTKEHKLHKKQKPQPTSKQTKTKTNTNSNGVNQEKIARDEPKCMRDSGKQFSSIQAGPVMGLYSMPCMTGNFKHSMTTQACVQTTFCVTLQSDFKSVFCRFFSFFKH